MLKALKGIRPNGGPEQVFVEYQRVPEWLQKISEAWLINLPSVMSVFNHFDCTHCWHQHRQAPEFAVTYGRVAAQAWFADKVP